MKLRHGIFIILVFFFVIQPVSAIMVSPVMVKPEGSLLSGELVKVSLVIDLGRSKPGENGYNISTDLENAHWNYSIVEGGRKKPFPALMGKSLLLYGDKISTDSSGNVSAVIFLEGNAIGPSCVAVVSKTLVRINLLDQNGKPVYPPLFEREGVIVSGSDCMAFNPEVRSDLDYFKYLIDQFAEKNIDTTNARAQYLLASQKYELAMSRRPDQTNLFFRDLNDAQTLISDGMTGLYKGWAEKTVVSARQQINKTNELLGFFTGNTSTMGNINLSSSIRKRDLAVTSHSAAMNDIAQGNFVEARYEAEEAFRLANESYSDLLIQQKILTAERSCTLPFCAGGLRGNELVIIILFLSGVGIGGTLLWKRHRKP